MMILHFDQKLMKIESFLSLRFRLPRTDDVAGQAQRVARCEQRLGGRVHLDDRTGLVEDDDAVRHRFEGLDDARLSLGLPYQSVIHVPRLHRVMSVFGLRASLTMEGSADVRIMARTGSSHPMRKT